MSVFTSLISYFWAGLEGVMSAPYRLRRAVRRDLRRWRRQQALNMVLTAAWAEGFDPAPVAQAVLGASRLELVGWMYDDRSLLITPRHREGVLVVHRGPNGVYVLTDLTKSEKH